MENQSPAHGDRAAGAHLPLHGQQSRPDGFHTQILPAIVRDAEVSTMLSCTLSHAPKQTARSWSVITSLSLNVSHIHTPHTQTHTTHCQAFWVDVPSSVQSQLQASGLHLWGGLHAIAHCLLHLLPMAVLCDSGQDMKAECVRFFICYSLLT